MDKPLFCSPGPLFQSPSPGFLNCCQLLPAFAQLLVDSDRELLCTLFASSDSCCRFSPDTTASVTPGLGMMLSSLLPQHPDFPGARVRPFVSSWVSEELLGTQ